MAFGADISILLAVGLFSLGLLVKNTADTARLKARVDGLCARIQEIRSTMDSAAFK